MTTQHKIEIAFGVGEDADGNPLHADFVNAGLTAIQTEAARVFGGCTLINSHGYWINPAGSLAAEPSCVLVICTDNLIEQRVACLAGYIRGALRQHSVAVTITPVRNAFLSNEKPLL